MVLHIQIYVKVDGHRDPKLRILLNLCLLCDHDGLSTTSRVFLDHVGGNQTGLCGCSIISSGFMVLHIQIYVKVDGHRRSQGIVRMIKMCLLFDHDGLSTTSRVFLDHV